MALCFNVNNGNEIDDGFMPELDVIAVDLSIGYRGALLRIRVRPLRNPIVEPPFNRGLDHVEVGRNVKIAGHKERGVPNFHYLTPRGATFDESDLQQDGIAD